MLSSLILRDNEQFLDQIVTWDEKWILYHNRQQPAQWLDRKEVPKHFRKPNLHQKKLMVTVWWTCCPSDPLQLSESWQNHYIWETCSANQWEASKTATPAVSISQQKGPNSPQYYPTTCHTTHASQVERTGLQSFASSAIFTWLLASELLRLQASQRLFAGKCFHNQQARCRKCFPRIKQIPKHEFLCYRNKQTYFSMAKMCWL